MSNIVHQLLQNPGSSGAPFSGGTIWSGPTEVLQMGRVFPLIFKFVLSHWCHWSSTFHQWYQGTFHYESLHSMKNNMFYPNYGYSQAQKLFYDQCTLHCYFDIVIKDLF